MCLNTESMMSKRSKSPMPPISRALFHDIKVTSPNSARPKRPSIEEDYERVLLTSCLTSTTTTNTTTISAKRPNRRMSITTVTNINSSQYDQAPKEQFGMRRLSISRNFNEARERLFSSQKISNEPPPALRRLSISRNYDSKENNVLQQSQLSINMEKSKPRRLSISKNYDENRENVVHRNQMRLPSRPRSRGLSERDTNIFRFSEVGSPPSVCMSPLMKGIPSSTLGVASPLPGGAPGTCQGGLPRISVYQDNDDVFLNSPYDPPHSSGLLLTPSTIYSPRPSSCTSLALEYSPNIALGIQCNTPSRLKIELEGLGTEKLVLGRGAYGTVVLGQWRGQKCAVKVMEKEEGGKVSSRRRKSLQSELQALKLDHDNIVKVHGVFGTADRYAVIIMEYVGSRNLHRLLIEMPDKHLGRSWLLGAARQVSAALTHCHSKGVVHMDVKPANVLVTSSGTCKLGDFGCSVGVDSGDVPLDHSLVGTPGYQAPEFLRGGLPSPACDIYSLGIFLWQLDSREVPFQGQHPQTIMFRTVSVGARPTPSRKPTISNSIAGLVELYKQCWSAEPENRPKAGDVHNRMCHWVSIHPFMSTNSIRL